MMADVDENDDDDDDQHDYNRDGDTGGLDAGFRDQWWNVASLG